MEAILLLTATVLSLVAVRMMLMGFSAPDFSPSDNPASDSDSVLTRSLTFAFLPALNFYLLLCPTRLSFDWSMSAVPLVGTWSDTRNLMTSAFYGALILMTWRVLRLRGVSRPSGAVVTSNGHCGDVGGLKSTHSRRGSSHVLLLALALLVLPFIPATNLFFYVGFVVAERVLYIPSAGYCLLVSVAVTQCFSRRRRHRVLGFSRRASGYVMSVLLMTSLAVRTLVRNADWLNEEALYRSGISVNPAKGLSVCLFVFLFVCLSLSVSFFTRGVCINFLRLLGLWLTVETPQTPRIWGCGARGGIPTSVVFSGHWCYAL